MKDAGCPRGDKCAFRHPPRQGKCLRCGAIGHKLAQCRRPQRDQKGSSSTSTSTPPSTPRDKAKSKGAPRAKSQPQKKEQGNATTWAAVLESTVTIEESPEGHTQEDHSATYTESFAVNSPKSKKSTKVQRNSAKGGSDSDNAGIASDKPNKAPILDTGATRCLLHLDWIDKEDADSRKDPLRSSEWNSIKGAFVGQHHVLHSYCSTFDQHRSAESHARLAIGLG